MSENMNDYQADTINSLYQLISGNTLNNFKVSIREIVNGISRVINDYTHSNNTQSLEVTQITTITNNITNEFLQNGLALLDSIQAHFIYEFPNDADVPLPQIIQNVRDVFETACENIHVERPIFDVGLMGDDERAQNLKERLQSYKTLYKQLRILYNKIKNRFPNDSLPNLPY